VDPPSLFRVVFSTASPRTLWTMFFLFPRDESIKFPCTLDLRVGTGGTLLIHLSAALAAFPDRCGYFFLRLNHYSCVAFPYGDTSPPVYHLFSPSLRIPWFPVLLPIHVTDSPPIRTPRSSVPPGIFFPFSPCSADCSSEKSFRYYADPSRSPKSVRLGFSFPFDNDFFYFKTNPTP